MRCIIANIVAELAFIPNEQEEEEASPGQLARKCKQQQCKK